MVNLVYCPKVLRSRGHPEGIPALARSRDASWELMMKKSPILYLSSCYSKHHMYLPGPVQDCFHFQDNGV